MNSSLRSDFTEDLTKIMVPVLVMHGDDNQIVPYADSGPLSAKLVQHATLKTYHGYPRGMPTTQAATINADLLAWLQSLAGRHVTEPARRQKLTQAVRCAGDGGT
jgi:pimeloyl-ACP methyl ester carboxylesterase